MSYEHELKWKIDPPKDLGSLIERTVRPCVWPRGELEYWPHVVWYLKNRGLSPELAHANSWYPGYYHGMRIIIPARRTDRGEFWQGRLLDQIYQGTYHIEESGWKRWDSPHGPRGDAIVLLEPPDRRGRGVVVVEGPMDALAAAEFGFLGVATLGVQPNSAVLDHIASVAKKYPWFCIIPDRDELGRWAHTQAELGKRGIYGSILLPPSPYKDLAETPRESRKEMLEEWYGEQA